MEVEGGPTLELEPGVVGVLRAGADRAVLADPARRSRKVFQITDVARARSRHGAVELYDWLLALHVLSAVAWIAALVVFSVVVVGRPAA